MIGCKLSLSKGLICRSELKRFLVDQEGRGEDTGRTSARTAFIGILICRNPPSAGTPNKVYPTHSTFDYFENRKAAQALTARAKRFRIRRHVKS